MMWCYSNIMEDGAGIKISSSQARLLKHKYGKEAVKTSLSEKEIRYVILANVMHDIVNSDSVKVFVICKNKAEVIFYNVLLRKLMVSSGFSEEKIKVGEPKNSVSVYNGSNNCTVVFSVMDGIHKATAKVSSADAVYAYIPKNANNKSANTIISLSVKAKKILMLLEKEKEDE